MDSPKKVYIVTSGEYSSYRIEAVFSTEADADEYAGRHGNHDVEEWVLDEAIPVGRTGQTAFQVSYSIGKEHLYIEPPSPWNATGDIDKPFLPFEHVHHEDTLHMGTQHVTETWETWVWADDAQAALKIGADRIMPVLAEHQIEGVEAPKETINGE